MHIWGCPHDARTIASIAYYDVYTIARQSAIYIHTYIHTMYALIVRRTVCVS